MKSFWSLNMCDRKFCNGNIEIIFSIFFLKLWDSVVSYDSLKWHSQTKISIFITAP